VAVSAATEAVSEADMESADLAAAGERREAVTVAVTADTEAVMVAVTEVVLEEGMAVAMASGEVERNSVAAMADLEADTVVDSVADLEADTVVVSVVVSVERKVRTQFNWRLKTLHLIISYSLNIDVVISFTVIQKN